MMSAGIVDAADGYCLIRPNPSHGAVRVSFSGAGRVLVNDKWVMCPTGMAYISPPHQFHAYHTLRGKPWGMLWVAYLNPPDPREVCNVSAPTLIHADPRALHAAISGLYSEISGPRQAHFIRRWVELVHLNVVRLNSQMGKIDRLWQVWQEVDCRLAHDWTRSELADVAGMSGEYLRQICQAQYGHSPLQHLTHLRMQRAAGLLTASSQKIEAIAHQVGYSDGFAFSTAFKRWAGVSPAAYRSRQASGAPPRRD